MDEENIPNNDQVIESLLLDIDMYKEVIENQNELVYKLKEETNELKEKVSMYEKFIKMKDNFLNKFFTRNGLTIHDLEEFENEQSIDNNKG